MFPLLERQTKEILGPAEVLDFKLSRLKNFPEAEFQRIRINYESLYEWYTGEQLDATQVQGGKTVEKYPIKMNPIKGAVFKHAHALFGEVSDDSKPLAPAILRPDELTDAKKDQAQRGQDFLNMVWAESHGRAMMSRNALLAQILGGCVFKASYVPLNKFRTYPFKVESIYPSNFVGIPASGEEFRLEEAWIIKPLGHDETKRKYGLTFPETEPIYYIEYWNPDEYTVSINGYSLTTGVVTSIGREILYGGKNPWGFVPITYIPRMRASGFYGSSLITENVTAIVEEMNRRAADLGDAVSDDSHSYYKLVGSSQSPEVKEVAPGLRLVRVPPEPSISGKELQPELDQLGSPRASESMAKFVDMLYNEFRREAFVPAVADGEDEGSQRSALTLAMRMWPLLSQVSMQRIAWGDGLAHLDNMILRMAVEKSVGELPKAVTKMRIERRWAPFLPTDREKFVSEMVNRASANLGSLEHLIGQFDDVDDPQEQYKLVTQQLKQLADIEANAQAEALVARMEASNANNNNNRNSNSNNTSSSQSNNNNSRSK